MKARAVRIEGRGGPEVLALGEIDVRDPGPGEVRISVAAAGLNRADCLQRRGFYPAPPGVAPDVPGLEIAGTIESIGHGVVAFRPGDRVMGIVAGGGMAELCTTSEREIVRVPSELSLTDAGAIPEVFMTAYDALFVEGQLTMGRRALLHAVGSGIGTAAIQLVRAAGGVSIGTSRSADKLTRCAELGLSHGVLAEAGRFADAVLRAAPEGADVVLDTVGAAYLGENVAALSKRGTIVVIGLLGGVNGELPLGALLAKRGRVVGSVLRSRAPEEKASLTQRFAAEALPLFERGALRPVVDAVLPMADVREAHRRMDANETFGKIVLAW